MLLLELKASIMQLKFAPWLGTVCWRSNQWNDRCHFDCCAWIAYIEVMNKIAIKVYNGHKVDSSEIIGMTKRAYEEQLKKGKSIIADMDINQNYSSVSIQLFKIIDLQLKVTPLLQIKLTPQILISHARILPTEYFSKGDHEVKDVYDCETVKRLFKRE